MRCIRLKPFLVFILVLLFPIIGIAEEPKVITPLSGVTWMTVNPAVTTFEQHKPTLRVLPAVTSPKANAKWKAGKKHEIKWVGINAQRVKIELFQRAQRRMVIASSAVNKGIYNWQIPVRFRGSNFRLVIRPAVYTKKSTRINSPNFTIY